MIDENIIDFLTVHERYKGLDTIPSLPGDLEEKPYNRDIWMTTPTYKIAKQSDEQVKEMFEGIMKVLDTGISESTMLDIVTVASQLKLNDVYVLRKFEDQAGRLVERNEAQSIYSFLPDDKKPSTNTLRVHTSAPLTGGTINLRNIQIGTSYGTETASIQAAACSYLMASLYRLITKSTDSYVGASRRIKESFSNFFNAESSIIRNFNMDNSKLQRVKMGWEIFQDVRRTAICSVVLREIFATSFNEGRGTRGLAKTLVLQNLEFTGMHIYELFISIQPKYPELTHELLLYWLRAPRTCDGLKAIDRIHKTYDVEGEEVGWKFARALDPSYFASLQSSKHLELLAILSKIYEKSDGYQRKDSASPSDIAVLRNRRPVMDRADEFSTIFREHYFELISKAKVAESVQRTSGVSSSQPPRSTSGQKRAHGSQDELQGQASGRKRSSYLNF